MENKIYSTANADEVKIGTYGIFSDDYDFYEKIDLTRKRDLNHIKKLKEICHDGSYYCFEAFRSEYNSATYRFFKPVFSEENKEAFYYYMENGAVKDRYGNIYDLNSEETPDWLNVIYTKALFSDLIKFCKTQKINGEYRLDGLNLKDYYEYYSWKCLNEYFSAIENLLKFLKDNKIPKFFTRNGMSNFKFGLKHNRNFDELYDKYTEYVTSFTKIVDEILKLDDQYISYIKKHIYSNMYSDLYNLIPDKYLKELGFNSFFDITETNDNFRKFNTKLVNMFYKFRNDDCLDSLVTDFCKSVNDMIMFLNYNHFYKLFTHSEICKIFVKIDSQDVNNLQKLYKRFINVYVKKYVESYDTLVKRANFDKSYVRIYKNLKPDLEKLVACIPDEDKRRKDCPNYMIGESPVIFCSEEFYMLNNFIKRILKVEE